MKIYTKKGDDGKTSLVSGHRLVKSNIRIDVYGEVDELNSFLGLFIAKLLDHSAFQADCELLTRAQSRLFDLGSNLACESELREQYKLPKLTEEDVTDFEVRIDVLSATLPELKNFILPGGHELVAWAHVLRTISRRVERSMVRLEFEVGEKLPEHAIAYMNRFSDYFFILARALARHLNVQEVIWKGR